MGTGTGRLAVLLAGAGLLSGCGGDAQSPKQVIDAAGAGDRTLSCRTGDQKRFLDNCTREWRGSDETGRHILVLRQGGGGFHRLLIGSDGRIGPADGVEPVVLVGRRDGKTEIVIGPDHFLLSAAQLRPVS